MLVVSDRLPYPVVGVPRQAEIGARFDTLLARLTKRFSEVQYFGSYRVVDAVTWARARNGKPIRMFTYADGEVYANEGAQTPEEAELGFVDLTGLSLQAACDKLFQVAEEEHAKPSSERRPRAFLDESDVIDLARAWSVDPTDLSDQPAGVRLAARLPPSLQS